MTYQNFPNPKKSKTPLIVGGVILAALLMILVTVVAVLALTQEPAPSPTKTPEVVATTTAPVIPTLPSVVPSLRPTIDVAPTLAPTLEPFPTRTVNPILRDAFLKTVKKKVVFSRISDNDLVDVGLASCSDFDRGFGLLDQVRDITSKNPSVTVEDAAYLVGASAASFCQEHLSKLEIN